MYTFADIHTLRGHELLLLRFHRDMYEEWLVLYGRHSHKLSACVPVASCVHVQSSVFICTVPGDRLSVSAEEGLVAGRHPDVLHERKHLVTMLF